MASNDLTVSKTWQPVSTDAPKPTARWLVARVRVLLSHFYQPDLSAEEEELAMADWIDALSDLPQDAVERAIRARVLSGDRARPLPGEIRERAKAFIAQAEREPEPAPFAPPPPLTAEQIARRREIAAEYGMRVLDDGSVEPGVKRASGAGSC